MLSSPDGRVLPRDTVRDLLAIARVLYRERAEAKAPAEELAQLKKAGECFVSALKLAVHDPWALGHRAAWNWANQGIELLGQVLSAKDSSARALLEGAHGVLKRVPRP